MPKPLLVGSRVGPEAVRRMQAAYDAGVSVSTLSRRFDLSPCWVRHVLQTMAASSSGALGDGLQIAS